MLGVRLEPEMEKRLERLAKETGRTKSYYAKEAIRQYIEDQEDYLLAVEISRRNEPTISMEELAKKYGLESILQQKRRKTVRKAGSGNSGIHTRVLPRKSGSGA